MFVSFNLPIPTFLYINKKIMPTPEPRLMRDFFNVLSSTVQGMMILLESLLFMSNFISKKALHFSNSIASSSLIFSFYRWYPLWILHKLVFVLVLWQMKCLYAAFGTFLETCWKLFHLSMSSLFEDREVLSQALIVFPSLIQ